MAKSVAGLFRIWLLMPTLLLTPTAVSAQSGNKVTLDQVNAAIPSIDAFAQELVRREQVPGLSIAIVFQDRVVFLKGFGVREMGKGGPVTEDTVFQLASVSKPVATTVVAALVGDGVVTWDTRVSAINPEFQLNEAYPTQQVTLRDLFSMRSGLPGSAGDELEDIGYGQAEILRRLRYIKPASSFRSSYSYSNHGFTAGAVAAAKPTGKAWEVVASEKLYQPLGMTSTSSRYADFLSRTNRAELHVPVDGKWVALVKREPDPQAPAGGVSSSARDLAQWVRLQLGNGKLDGKQVISEDALAQTRQPLIHTGPAPVLGGPSFYGLGWGVRYDAHGRVRVGHGGAFSAGGRTLVNLIPSEQLAIVVLTNAYPTGAPEAISEKFFELVHEGTSTRDWLTEWTKVFASLLEQAETAGRVYETTPGSPAASLPLTAYAGTYGNQYLGNVEVVEKSGALELQAGPNKRAYPLRHFARDLFTMTPLAELPRVRTGVTFTIGPDQRATQVMIETLNDLGQGVLMRVEKPARD